MRASDDKDRLERLGYMGGHDLYEAGTGSAVVDWSGGRGLVRVDGDWAEAVGGLLADRGRLEFWLPESKVLTLSRLGLLDGLVRREGGFLSGTCWHRKVLDRLTFRN